MAYWAPAPRNASVNEWMIADIISIVISFPRKLQLHFTYYYFMANATLLLLLPCYYCHLCTCHILVYDTVHNRFSFLYPIEQWFSNFTMDKSHRRVHWTTKGWAPLWRVSDKVDLGICIFKKVLLRLLVWGTPFWELCHEQTPLGTWMTACGANRKLNSVCRE